jgi:formylglycine-generating enzyme required for sulfatase activity
LTKHATNTAESKMDPMKAYSHHKSHIFLRLLTGCLLISSLSLAWAADYAALVTQAREQLQAERFVEALASARDAVRANAEDYQGHYYLAMAYMSLGNFDDAESAAASSLRLSPANVRPGVEKLAAAIKTRRQGTNTTQAADAALADGLAGKAARLYEQGWNAGRDNPELGLKAAELYANRLSQPEDAGRVLRQVRLAAKGSAAADRAEAELRKLAGPLQQIAQAHVSAASKLEGPAAFQELQLAEDADPEYKAIYSVRAQVAAKGNNLQALQDAVKGLARRDLAQPSLLAALPRMTQWLDQAAFAEFLTDILGNKQVASLRELAKNPGCADCQGTKVNPRDGLTYVWLQPDSFTMGCSAGDNECEGDEKPPVQVTISKGFWLGATEVTQAAYRRVTQALPDVGFAGANRPVENVNWSEAVSYCAAVGMRLPTEAEWEYAARAGTAQGRYGDLDSIAWYGSNSGKQTHEVAKKQANPWGLYDMLGNVWEWTADWYADYPSGSVTDPKGPSTGTKRVLRGGSWYVNATLARASNRLWYVPELRSTSSASGVRGIDSLYVLSFSLFNLPALTVGPILAAKPQENFRRDAV